MNLDVFSIIFEGDTSKLNSSLDKSDKAADKLTDELKDVDRQANKTGEAFAGFAARALGALTAALGVGSAIAGTITKAQEISNIAQSADALGEAVEVVDAFGRSAAALGGDAQGARDSLTDMAEAIGEALSDVDSQRAKTFAGLKVSLKGVDGQAVGAVEGILRLSESVEGLSRNQAIFQIKQLGITDNRTVEMVLKGRKELERLLAVQKASGVITKQQAEEAKRFTEELNKLRGATDTAGTGFMASLIPALTKVVEWLTVLVEWAGKHSDVIVGFFAAIAAVILAVYAPAMWAAAAATLAATWPIIAIAALVTAVAAAFALAYEDIMAFIEGNDSFIGQILEKYPIIGQAVDLIIFAFKNMFSVVGMIFDGLKAGFSGVVDYILKGVEMIKSGVATVASFFGIGGDGDAQAGQAAIGDAAANPLNSTTSNAISNSVASANSSTALSIDTLNIQTQATDANGVADGLGSALDNQLKNMETESANGVAR